MSEQVSTAGEVLDGNLIDVGRLPLAEVDRLDGSVLSVALQRLLEQGDAVPVAGFSAEI